MKIIVILVPFGLDNPSIIVYNYVSHLGNNGLHLWP